MSQNIYLSIAILLLLTIDNDDLKDIKYSVSISSKK